MARKSLSSLLHDPKSDAYVTLVEYQYIVAKEVYDKQDKVTQEAIDKIVSVLVTHYVADEYSLSPEQLAKSFFVIAMAVTTDLALLDIRLSNFSFAGGICVKCGGEIDGA